MFDTSVIPASYIVASAFRNSHLVFAATTYNAGVFVTMENLLHDLAAHNLQKRKVAIIENGSWAPMSGKVMKDLLAKLPGTEFIADTITIKSSLKPRITLDQLDAMADAIALEINPHLYDAKPAAGTAGGPGRQRRSFRGTDRVSSKFTYGVRDPDHPGRRQGLRLRHQLRRTGRRRRPEDGHHLLSSTRTIPLT